MKQPLTHWFRAITLTIVLSVSFVSCSMQESAVARAGGSETACSRSDNLLRDLEFKSLMERAGFWRYRQHGAESAFTYKVDGSVLFFSRTTQAEPWAFIVQDVADPRISGATLRFEADVAADVSDDVEHFFGAKAGLYLRIGKNDRGALLADHQPNVGVWDTQSLSYEVQVPEDTEVIRVGFLYQAGTGSLQASNPSLKVMSCGN